MLSLEKILDHRVIIEVVKKEQGSEIILNERDEASDISKLTIDAVPDDSIAFTLDYNDRDNKGKDSRIFMKLSPYISSSNEDGVNKSCDLVIISRETEENGENKIKIVVLDLKSNRTGKRGELQVENSVIFVNYILSLCKHHYKENIKNICFYKRLVTTKISKSPISHASKEIVEIKRISVKPTRREGKVSYDRLIC